jgi:putative ABC transport system substrate-binding protein
MTPEMSRLRNPSVRRFVERLAFGFIALVLTGEAFSSSQAGAGTVRRIGYITTDPPAKHAPFDAAFRKGLAEGGYTEGKNVMIDRRYGSPGAIESHVRDLIHLGVEVLVTDSTPNAVAAKEATQTLPIITISGDPVSAGLVASLRHPGGNVTAVSTLASGLASKRLTLLKELAPDTRRVAVFWVPHNPAHQFQIEETRAAAAHLGLSMQLIAVPGRDAIDRALASLTSVDALVVLEDTVLDFARPQVGRYALQKRLPFVCSYRNPDDESCLLWYGPNLIGLYERLGIYAARVLNGGTPAEIPVEQPTTFSLIINAKAAKALGIRVPASIMAITDEVLR